METRRFFLELEQVSEAIEKLQDTSAIETLVEQGKIQSETILLLQMKGLCELFGWKPQDILEMDVYYLNAFSAILKGQQKARQGEKEQEKKEDRKPRFKS